MFNHHNHYNKNQTVQTNTPITRCHLLPNTRHQISNTRHLAIKKRHQIVETN